MPDDNDTPAPTGAQLGALLDDAIERVLTAPDIVARGKAARTAREILGFLSVLTEPALAHERARFASESFEGGSEINSWTGAEIEGDPAKIAVVRRVAAQMLVANPGVLVRHQQHLLALRLNDLNNGEVGPLIRPIGVAPNILQVRKIGLGCAFWMRKGWDACSSTKTVELFLKLTDYSEASAVRRLSRAIPREDRPFWEALGAHRAGRPFPEKYRSFVEAIGRDKVPDPTDENIKARARLTT